MAGPTSIVVVRGFAAESPRLVMAAFRPPAVGWINPTATLLSAVMLLDHLIGHDMECIARRLSVVDRRNNAELVGACQDCNGPHAISNVSSNMIRTERISR